MHKRKYRILDDKDSEIITIDEFERTKIIRRNYPNQTFGSKNGNKEKQNKTEINKKNNQKRSKMRKLSKDERNKLPKYLGAKR